MWVGSCKGGIIAACCATVRTAWRRAKASMGSALPSRMDVEARCTRRLALVSGLHGSRRRLQRCSLSTRPPLPSTSRRTYAASSIRWCASSRAPVADRPSSARCFSFRSALHGGRLLVPTEDGLALFAVQKGTFALLRAFPETAAYVPPEAELTVDARGSVYVSSFARIVRLSL